MYFYSSMLFSSRDNTSIDVIFNELFFDRFFIMNQRLIINYCLLRQLHYICHYIEIFMYSLIFKSLKINSNKNYKTLNKNK